MDIFHKVISLPQSGQKGYFQNLAEPISAKLVGGVTLNHLCWARILGVSTNLLALQGNDNNGRLIRDELKLFDVGIDSIDVSDEYCTSVSHIFLDNNGERSIMMASGATSMINSDVVDGIFYKHLIESNRVNIFSTEISQVPLNGVIAMLDYCNSNDIVTIMDVDVPPSIAINEARLGSIDEVYQSVTKARIIKPTLEAAIELIDSDRYDINSNIIDIGSELMNKFGNEMIAITNGKQGSMFMNKNDAVIIDAIKGIKQIDSTGAGDAFFGGIIAGIYHYGIPTNKNDMITIGNIASVCGAANVEILGALPLKQQTQQRLIQLNPELTPLIDKLPLPIQTDSESQNISYKTSISNDIDGLSKLKDNINPKSLSTIINTIKNANKIYITGIGKSGIIAQRMAASLSSINYSSEYINGIEWIHGDIGKLSDNDIIISLSVSGKTPELYNSIQYIKQTKPNSIKIIGIFNINETDFNSSSLKNNSHFIGSFCDHILCLGSQHINSELLQHLPSTSIIIQESAINAILSELIGKDIKHYKHIFLGNHPGGNIGKISKPLF